MKLLASRYEKSFYIEALTESHNVISNSFLTLDIEGACDPALMQQAMHHVFSHPEFHVRYELQGEHLYKFANRQEYTIPLIDLTTQRDPESAFQQLLTTYYSEKLTFGDSLLFKACLCQIAPAHHRAIIMVHHICLDGTGFQRFFDELTQSYRRLRRGETLAPIAAPLAQEQAPPLSDALQQEALAFWTRALDGQPVRTDFNHAINSEQRRACTEKCALGTELSQRVKAYCRRSGLTPNLFFKGLYALLVGRMANQRMIAISSPMDRRSKAMRRQLGCFVNTRLDLFDLRSIATLSAYWAQIRQFNKATKPYAELPYAQLVHALQKQSPDPGAMLSNVVFGSTVGIGETYPLDAQCRIAQDYRFIDLNADLQLLFCESSQHSFNFRFDYLQGFQPCGLFTGFLARFQRLIEWALAQDDGEMAQMPFLGRAELDRLTQLNQRRQPYPDDSLAQRVHRWVQETPAATALIDSEHNQAIGYAQLHERVSAIAHYLSTLTPADHRGQGCVVINLTSLVDTVVAILATQYCGLAFTCVDASAPMARKQLIMEQLSPLLLIGDAIPGAQASHAHHLAALEHIPSAPGRYLPHAGAAEQISQYIFTSGTTGQPKAVALTHRALVSTLYQNDAIPVGERLLYSANEAFDAASLQLWLALLHGRTLVIPQRGDIANPHAMTRLLQQHQIDHLFLTTGLFETYMASAKREIFGQLEILCFGGDSVSQQAVAQGLECNIRHLINLYGPTETSIYVTAHRCGPRDLAAGVIPIGKPRPNAQTWIVDDRDNLLGIGMVGHIIVSGDGLAQGYLGQPQHEAFSSIRLADATGESARRIYRTGDYGYWREDGELVFCGRRDHQVKLRGYRIELGEIRQALEQIDGVTMAIAVLSRKGQHKRLLGYYQAAQPLDNQYLCQQLQQRLPSYMVPAQLIYLEQLPLNRNGKLDRQALPEPELIVEQDDSLTPLQQALLAQAASVLSLPSLTLGDDFVAQGGDSISAILFSVGLEEQGIRLSTADIMKYRCFADMARQASWVASAQTCLGKQTGDVALLPAQRWFFAQAFDAPAHFNQAITLRLPAPVDDARLASALKLLTRYHDSFWLRFTPDGRQFFADPGAAHVTLATLDAVGWSQVERQAAEMNAAFQLRHGPLLQALRFTLADDGATYLYLCAHHLIVDGVSWRRIAADLQSYYEQGAAFTPAPYSNTQCYRSQWETFQPGAQEVDYWLRHADALAACRTGAADSRLQRRQISLTPQQTQALLGQANHPYGTQINELLISALYRLLHHPEHGLGLLLEGHGRKAFGDTIRSEATVGWFTSIFPLHLPPHAGGWDSLIKQTKQTLRTLPDKGENYLHIAYHHPDPGVQQSLQAMLQLPVSFNFLGRFGHGGEGEWAIEHHFNHHLVAASNKPLRDLDINAWISADRLYIDVEMAGVEVAGMTLAQLCERFGQIVDQLLTHCCDPRCRGGLVPCDLEDVALDQATIARLEHQVGPLDTIYPATDFQRELLYFNRANPDYQIDQLVFQLEGALDRQAFADAWRRVLARYDMLRAGFSDSVDPGQPLALIARQVPLPLHIMDWEGQDSERLLQQCIIEERQRPFDWSKPPLLRLALARLSDRRHLLLFTFHHVLFDGWSMQIFLREIRQDYERLTRGERIPLPPSSFAAFPRWLAAQDTRAAADFWGAYLADAPMNMRIPADVCDDGGHALRVQSVKCRLEEQHGAPLQAFARRYGLTLNQLCQLAWAITLAKYTHGRDIVFGTTLTRRPVEISRVTDLVGLFVATPPLRVKLTESLDAVAQQLIDAAEPRTEHAFHDLNRYDERWRPTAPFGTLFVFENYPEQKSQEHDLVQYHHRGTVSGSNHQIVLCQFPADSMPFSLFYDSAELSAALAERIAHDYRTTLQLLPASQQLSDLLPRA
ncbi:Carrier domain-containing protein [Edwardsiella anguillarum]|uniref:condensation domain-containing protein n=1 Tax=Edwardsiella TaxID=635 RepID=UPI00045C7691|nr:condensation domain-containing protein [Edwardsiella anguillarum]AKM47652.1 hypothetical protein QY76_10150 [Edwardsiella sp. EA181011]GAJ68617.1 hypothetical protein MA13_contig00012-0017 [Edwardsiella piscicida]RFT01777.1 hypothetical protein CGL57_15245 [Edwardsiella anguillarum]BET84480.1 Carrier domain-containing protein [Edwardsiella anguillarum]BET87846.1 Carrier domain-containing protein [Edwardsiella anguillarum]